MTKRLTNTTGIKVKFIGATNTKGARLKVTQMNTNESKFVSFPYGMEIIEYTCKVLDSINSIKSHSLMVDNTQSDSYIFNIDFIGNSFEDIITYFK